MKTLDLMRRLIREGRASRAVQTTAFGILNSAGITASDTLGALRALYLWARDRVRYTADPPNVELLQGAPYMLHRLAGDCDDYAVLLGSLIQSIPLPVSLRFKAIAANPRQPATFSHVYLTAQLPGRPPIALDPIYRSTPFGGEYSHPLRTIEVPV